ncbi:MAG: 30S ribosomal protein S13 [archaeon]
MSEEQQIAKEQEKVKKVNPHLKQEEYVKLVRILQKDIRGDKKLYRGICDIRGISWIFSNAVCKMTGVDRNKKIQDLTQEEIQKIEKFISEPHGLPGFLFNRRNDRDEGVDKHVYGADLHLQVDFDIKRLKKIKAYKGVRHTLGQPVRGQRTKSHFRKNKKKSGMSKTPTDNKAKMNAAAMSKGVKK